MKTQVTITFALESLTPLDTATLQERLENRLTPESSDNFFEDCDHYALFDPTTLTVDLQDVDAKN